MHYITEKKMRIIEKLQIVIDFVVQQYRRQLTDIIITSAIIMWWTEPNMSIVFNLHSTQTRDEQKKNGEQII